MELGSRISHDDGYWKSFPPGYRFKPRDEELIIYYLKPKLFNEGLPPNRILEVQLYHHNPETLVEYESYGEGEWYFFTPRDKKYRNGSRPRRAAGDGFWKATGADRNILNEGFEIGFRKALVFYRGKPPKGEKTDWMMHEYRLKDPPAIANASTNEMRLDDCVLCKIYKKTDMSTKTPEDEGIENQDMDSATIPPPVEEAPPEPGLEAFHLVSEVEEHGAFNGLPASPPPYYHALTMWEQNPHPLFTDHSSDLASLPPLPGNQDHFLNDDDHLSYNFDSSPDFNDPVHPK